MRPRRYLRSFVLLLLAAASVQAVIAQTPGSSVGEARVDPPAVFFSPAPGVYADSLELSVSPAVDGEALWYRFAEDRDDRFLPLNGAISLEAPPHSEWRYTVEIARRSPSRDYEILASAEYRIDRLAPAAPQPDPPPGVYRDRIDISFPGDGEILYRFAERSDDWSATSGSISLSTAPGERREYRLIAYRRDEAGRRSPAFQGRYVLDGAEASAGGPELRILNPIEGSYANPQLLVVESSGLEEIRYSLDGSFPVPGGTRYEGPVLIPRSGEYRLRVAGRTSTGSTLEKEVLVRAGEDHVLDVTQGAFTATRQIPPPDGDFRFTSDGSPPGQTGRRFAEALSLSPSAGVRRVVVLRMIPLDGADSAAAEYRYLFVLEGREPAQPEAIVHSAGSGELTLSMLSSPGARIYYSLDGSNPRDGRLYRGPEEVELPAGREEGSLSLRAIARYSGVSAGEMLEREISFDSAPPPTPRLELVESGRRGRVRVLPGSSAEGQASATAGYLYELRDAAGESSGAGQAAVAARRRPMFTGERLVFDAPAGSHRRVSLQVSAVDAAGNRSEPTESLLIDLDGKAPPPPEATLEGRRLQIDGERVMYALQAPQSLEDDEVGARTFAAYSAPILLSARPATRLVYQLQAYGRDEHGNRSELLRRPVVLDNRRPSLPDGLGIEDGGRYREAVRLDLSGGEPDLRLRYALRYRDLQNGAESGEPAEESASELRPDRFMKPNGLLLDAPEGAERRYEIALQPVLASSERSGRVERLSVVIDRRAPAPPAVEGVTNGARYGEARRLTLVPLGEGETTEYALDREVLSGPAAGSESSGAGSSSAVSRSGESARPETAAGSKWFPGGDSILLDSALGTDTAFTLRSRSIDEAGNVSETGGPIRFRIDRAAPSAPKIRIDGAGARTATRYLGQRSAEIRMSGEGTLHYRLWEGTDAELSAPSPGDPPYEAPISLSAPPNGEATYRIQAIAVDAAGNLSDATPVVELRLDAKPPERPEVVSIYTDDTGRGGTVIWRHEEDTQVRYRVRGDSGEPAFRTAEQVGQWQLPDRLAEATLEYFAEDPAGNRSARAGVAVRGFSAAPRPVLTGIDEGAVYGDSVLLRNETPEATVRYEVSTDGSAPPEVTRFSPILPATIPFNVAPGESIRYRVAARSFEEDARPSRPVSLSFTVDREAPDPPRIRGLQDGDFLTEDVRIRFAPTEHSIFYSLVESPELRRGEAEFRPYSDEFLLQATPGGVAHYRISAYSVDAAGNRSEQTETWDLFLGKEIVYVSASAPEGGRGTQDAPFSSLQEGITYALTEGKRTVFVAAGEYRVSEPLRLEGSLTLQGGFDPADWRQSSDARATLRLNEDLLVEGAAVVVTGGRLTMRRFSVSGTLGAGGEPAVPHGSEALSGETPAMLYFNGGVGFLQDLELRASGVSVLQQQAGDVTLKDLQVTELSTGELPLLQVREGRSVLDGVSLQGAAAGRRAPLVSVQRGQLLLENAELRPGGGERTVGIQGRDSRLLLRNSSLGTGRGSRSSRALELYGGSLRLENSRVEADLREGIATAVSAEEAELQLIGNDFRLSGGRGLAALATRGGSALIARNDFRGSGREQGFIHFLLLRDTDADMVGNAFRAAGGGEALTLRGVDGSLRFVNNTSVSTEIEGAAYGVIAGGESDILLQNNIFSHDGSGNGRATVAADADAALSFRSNSFRGWKALVERSTGGFSRVSGEEQGGLDALNGLLDFPGVSGEGNVSGSAPEALLSEGDGTPRLYQDAPEINAGSHPPEDLPYRSLDLEGQRRPAPADQGASRPGGDAPERPRGGRFDMGADEFYR